LEQEVVAEATNWTLDPVVSSLEGVLTVTAANAEVVNNDSIRTE
jgi:hypothetical protein